MAQSYSQLVGDKDTAGSIKSWVNDSTIPAGEILSEAEAWIYQRLRVREMQEVNAAFAFAASASSASLPTGFLDHIEFVPDGWGIPLRYVSEVNFFAGAKDETGAMNTGDPSKWTVIGTTAYVDVACTSTFSGTLTYYKTPTALSLSNETNFLTTRYPTLVRRACMAFAFEFKKDVTRKQLEITLAEQALALAASTNDLYRRGQITS